MRSFRASLFLKFTVTMAPQTLPDPQSDIFPDVLGFFPNQACLGVLIVRKRDRSGSCGPAVPPQPCGGSPGAAT